MLLGRFGKVIPTTFTLCSVTRYTGTVGIGEPRGRILQTKESNFLHGHWSDRINVVHYAKWVTGTDTPPTNMEWVVLCGTNGAPRVYLGVRGDDLQNIATAQAEPLSQDNTLVINTGQHHQETSAFACMEVITWNRALSHEEMVTLV